MPKERTEHTVNARGEETHPAFGIISVHRITSTPGEILFQSDIRHPAYVRIEIREATRNRELNHDFVFPHKLLAEISMSESQFASFVASGGTEGIPCTIDRTGEGDYGVGERPGLTSVPRLQLTHDEVRKSAHGAYEGIKRALSKYEEALGEVGKESSAARKSALSNLRSAVVNAEKNVDYVAQVLDEHAEKVVETSRADIETMISRMAERAGLEDTARLSLEEG